MPLPRRLAPLAACLSGLLATPFAAAQEAPREPLWEIGGFALGVSQQAYPGADEQVNRALVLPYGLYRGRYLRADDGGAGLRAVRTPRFELDIGVAGSFGSSADEVAVRRGMPNIGTLVEFGPRLKWNLGQDASGGRWRLDLPLRGVFDLSDSLSQRGVVFQPTLVWQRRAASGWAYGANVSALIGNQRLAATFYEVDPRYARPGRPAYQADAGLIAWRLGVSATRPLGRDWRVFGFARLDTVAGAANRSSPLVRQTTGGSVGLGVSYTWLRSRAPAYE